MINGNLAVRLKALQLYIYWGALKGLNYHLLFRDISHDSFLIVK